MSALPHHGTAVEIRERHASESGFDLPTQQARRSSEEIAATFLIQNLDESKLGLSARPAPCKLIIAIFRHSHYAGTTLVPLRLLIRRMRAGCANARKNEHHPGERVTPDKPIHPSSRVLPICASYAQLQADSAFPRPPEKQRIPIHAMRYHPHPPNPQTPSPTCKSTSPVNSSMLHMSDMVRQRG